MKTIEKLKSKKTIVVSIMVVAVVIVAYWFLKPGATSQASVVLSEKPQRGDISKTVITTGTVQPVNTVSVGSQVSGTIEKLYVDYNSVVKQGQLLAELDKTLFEASLNQAKSNYAQVKSQLDYQKGNFERQSQLYKVGAISKADYENALYAYTSAQAQADASAAQVQSAKKNLALASIYSPIDGTILSRSVSEGQTVAASFSTPTIFSIAKDLKQMQVEASVDEADIGGITEGDKVTFTVDAYPDDVFTGSLQQVRLNPTTTNNVVTYTTIIQTSNNDLKLKPGMTANITIYTKEVNDALLIPVKAIKFTPDSTLTNYRIRRAPRESKPGENSVWIALNGELIQKIIQTGLNNNTQVEVLGGLDSNEAVVTGSQQIAGGSAAPSGQGTSQSPFMPQRPGKNRTKK
ncbi:MAG TPA: efflux RND transporter periplasmic adaptor subunit [Bacteroidales bacterium]|nr:efflux RND transporter periplasmic adaptor subunit [Bacteroidales bacterium]